MSGIAASSVLGRRLDPRTMGIRVLVGKVCASLLATLSQGRDGRA